MLLLAFVSASCSAAGGGAHPTAASHAPEYPLATSFDEFAAEQCAALQSLFRAYGNPDTAGLSPLMRSLVDAIERGDTTLATVTAKEIGAELENARAHARAAGGWTPAGIVMDQLDRFLAATERMAEGRLAAIEFGSAVAEQEGQAAFEAAGGIEAWSAWLRLLGQLRTATGTTGPLPTCTGVPLG